MLRHFRTTSFNIGQLPVFRCPMPSLFTWNKSSSIVKYKGYLVPKAQAFLTFSLMKTPLTLELSAVFYMHRGFATAKAEQRRKMRVQEYSGKSHNTNPNETKSEGFFCWRSYWEKPWQTRKWLSFYCIHINGGVLFIGYMIYTIISSVND